jgi:hypothetical protein
MAKVRTNIEIADIIRVAHVMDIALDPASIGRA